MASETSPSSEPVLAVVGHLARGAVILTQSCDIIRSCRDKPLVDMAPLVAVDGASLELARRGRTVSIAYVPGVSHLSLAADLERVTSVEKSIIANWEKTIGCRTDIESRNFAEALRRKRGRFAFPNEFIELIRPLTKRLKEKHNKDSREGQMLRALREIRVRAAPSWDGAQIEVTLIFIKEADPDPADGAAWAAQIKQWLGMVKRHGAYEVIDGYVATLDDLTAREFVESDQLDFDHLSS